jgi:CheY-like chemotaxis protein
MYPYPNPVPPAESTQAFGGRDREQIEMGAQSGAHFQLAMRDSPPSPIAGRTPVKPRLILLFTSDRRFGQLVREALFETRTIVLLARTVADVLQIVCQRGPELDCVLMDFDGGCRGMTLINAVRTCYQQLSILVTTSKDAEHASAVAYANGARVCLNKPLHAAKLANAIADLNATHHQLVAA